MQIRMQNAGVLTWEQIQEFLRGSEGIEFSGQSRAELYGWVQQVLVGQEYAGQDKKQRGAIRAYLSKMTGRSLPQITRLIRKYRQEGMVQAAVYRRRQFPVKYGSSDIALLAETDCAHGWLSGPATLRIMKREIEEFGNNEYARLAEMSVAHVYNLRHSTRYRKLGANWEPTRSGAITIGERRKPDPQGRPGFLRIDTVHQGDWNGVKGVYHVNAVDSVTQWQVVGCVSRINEQYMLPVLEAMLHQFPFRILGFHSDNGSGFVNHDVGKLLKGLLIEFTRSRANRTQDNALVEGKNGAIIRKHLGYGHTARAQAHSRRARRGSAEVLHGAVQPLLELPSSVRICDGESGLTRQAATAIQARRLCDAVREAEVSAGGRAVLKAKHELCAVGQDGAADERHTMRSKDDGRQSGIVVSLQDRVAGSTAVKLMRKPVYGNAGRWKAWKTRKHVFQPSPRPWKSRKSARDFHIPTAPSVWADSEKPERNRGAAQGGKAILKPLKRSRKDGQRPTEPRSRSSFDWNRDFRIILRLENA
ncbi:MAG: hypothetical protein ACR2NN_22945 [Bryobacteraceae bacterium]